MIDIIFLIAFCFLVANQMAVLSVGYPSVWIAVRKRFSVSFLYVILLVALTLFSGLRTSYNDTYAYIHAFRIFDLSTFNFNILLEPYGGFDTLQFVIKKYVSTNPQMLLLITSFIVNSLFLWFFSKHGKHFGWTILAYFVLGPYVFSMAGLKQALSMCISLIALDRLLNNRILGYIFWIAVAYLFHPYISCLLILPLLSKRTWSFQMVLLFLVCVFFIVNLELLLDLARIIGKDYTVEEMTNNTINPIRVIVEIIPAIISLLYKNKINNANDKLLSLGVNMMILSSFLVALGLVINPIYFGRIATYFSVINAITVPMMLCLIIKGTGSVVLKLSAYFGFYFLYFLLDLTKLGSISFFTDLFKHVSLF